MSAGGAKRGVERALVRLAQPRAVLAPERGGAGFGVYPNNDRRRRPQARLSAADVRGLEAEGVLAALPEQAGFVLNAAGQARLRREAVDEGEAYAAQHRAIEARTVIDCDGALRGARGHADPLKRLAALRGGDGAPFLSSAEIAAAQRLRDDWERGQIGLVRGSDWRAGPKSNAARGGAAQEAALAARCDAGRRASEALEALAPMLRRVVERVCLHDDGLEALERSENWPARSGKIALKLGLAQLAQRRF